ETAGRDGRGPLLRDDAAPMRRADRRGGWAAVAALAPWTWFAVRNLGFVSELVATGLPVLYALAAVGLGVVGVVRKRPELAAGVASCILAGGLAVVGPWRAQPVPPPVRGLRIVAANIRSGNPSRARAVADALGPRGDLVFRIQAGGAKFTPTAEYPTVAQPSITAQGSL